MDNEMINNPDIVKKLKERFPLDDHEVRKGYWVTGKKYRYFSYIKREKIIDRFDEMFPMAWSAELSEPRIAQYYDKSKLPYNVVTISTTITIAGIARSFNGSDTDSPIFDGKGTERVVVAYDPKNTEKSAATDSFKRAAQQFGIGLYLYEDGPYIVADSDEEAWKQFTRWYQGNIEKDKNTGNGNSQPKPSPDEPRTKPFSEAQINNFVEHFMDRFEGSNHVRDVFATLEVSNLHEISGDYMQAINTVIATAYKNECPVRVEYVKYVVDGNNKYLVFCADPSGSKHKEIRAYGRSTTVKNALNELRPGLYETLALDQLSNANRGQTTDWYPLDAHLIVSYQDKGSYLLAVEYKLPEDETVF